MCNNLIPFLGCIINEWRNEIRLSHHIRQQDNLIPRFLSREQKDVEIGGSCIFLYLFFLVCIFWAYDPSLIKCLFTLVLYLLVRKYWRQLLFVSELHIFFHVLLNCNFLKINISHGFKFTTPAAPHIVHRTVFVFCPCACAVERRIPFCSNEDGAN